MPPSPLDDWQQGMFTIFSRFLSLTRKKTKIARYFALVHPQRFWISSLLPVLSVQMVPCGQNMSPWLWLSPHTTLRSHWSLLFQVYVEVLHSLQTSWMRGEFSQQYSPQILVRVINRALEMESQPLAITCNKTRIFCNKLLLRTFNQHLHFAKQ